VGRSITVRFFTQPAAAIASGRCARAAASLVRDGGARALAVFVQQGHARVAAFRAGCAGSYEVIIRLV